MEYSRGQRAEERQKKQGEQKTNLTFPYPKLGYSGYLGSLCQAMSCCVVNPFQVLHFSALKRMQKLKRVLNKRTQHPITIFLSFWSGYNLMIFFFFSQEYGTRFQIFTPKKKNLLRFYEVFTILYNAYIKLLVYKKENYNNFTTDAQYYNSLLLALVSTCTDAQYFMTRFFFFTLEWRFPGNFFTQKTKPLCYLQRCFHWKKS